MPMYNSYKEKNVKMDFFFFHGYLEISNKYIMKKKAQYLLSGKYWSSNSMWAWKISERQKEIEKRERKEKREEEME